MRKRVVSITLVLTMLLALFPLPVAIATEPYILTAEDFANQETYVKHYDRTFAAEPVIWTEVNGETVFLGYEKAEFTGRYVGAHDVVVEDLSVSGNYQLADGFDSLTIPGRILAAETRISHGQIEAGETLDLSTLVENGGEYLYFEIQGEKRGASISGSLLETTSKTGSLSVWASCLSHDVNGDGVDEYTGLEKAITVTITEPGQDVPPVDPPATQKLPQAPLVIHGGGEVVYGQTLQLTCSGGSTGQEVVWGFADFGGSGQATISPKGLFTPVKAGESWVTATMPGDDTYQDAVSDAFPITIRPATITITANDKTAVVGEEVPPLTADDYMVTGLIDDDKLAVQPTISYETSPDMTKAGEVTIQISGAVPPSGGNYEIVYVPGKLIIGETYPITVNQAEGGTVTGDMTQDPEGAVVTLTVKPEEGFILDTIKVESGSTVIQTTEAGEGKFTFTMPSGGVMVTPTFAEEVPLEMPFTDIMETDWFYDSVAYVYLNGLMNGTSATTFTPNGTTTRGMIVTILYRLAGSPEGPSGAPFQDVDPKQYYAAPIAWAAWNGIVTGKSAVAFAPNDPITREQMAAILYRYAGKQGMDVSVRGDLTGFIDQGKISPYARDALAWANGAGLITGKGEGILDPQGPAVRAQVAAIFQRFCEGVSQ